MGRSTFQQPAFLGGEFSPFAQGRSDIPQYKQAMSLCLNGHPVEEGPWVKRSGFEFCTPTRGRTYGRMLPFDGSATCAFGMLFTDDNLQFITATGSLVFDNTISTITDSISSTVDVTISPAQSGWNTGDQVMLVFPDASSPLYPYPIALEAGLRGRLLTIAVVDSTSMVLQNDLGVVLTSDLSASAWPSGALVGAQIMRVLNIATTYATVETLQTLRAVQIEYQSIILSSSEMPQVVQVTTPPTVGPGGTDPVFSLSALGMVDGPYLDPSGDTGTVSGYTGTITFTATATTPFVSTDVGRHLRLFSEPAQWAAGTAYTAGEVVTDQSGAWWTAVINSTGVIPGQPTVVSGVQQIAWAPAPFAGSWAWGKITIVHSSSQVSVALDTTIPNMVLQSGNGTLMASFQLGVYTAGSFPTCGAYHQGRLWVGGAVANRFDTTVSNGVALGIATWSPTDPNGNVLDSSGMSEIFNSKFVNNIQWIAPTPLGLVMGTLNGEFLVTASNQNDPITPTDIQSWMATKYGCAFVEPVFAGMALIYVQKYGQRLMEYLADAFSQKFSGRHLNEWGKHLASSGIAEIVYQEETFPCVWARMNNGLLAGCTYRRFSRFVSEPPNIAGWHWHVHGRQRGFTSLCIIPGKQGLLERMFAVTNDILPPSVGQAPFDNYFVEAMQPFFDQNQNVLQGWFEDEAPGPGPGADPAYDCGGGNAAAFRPTGTAIGVDAYTPDVTTLPPYTSATTPAVGADLGPNLALLEATYVNGQQMLYSLPPYPSYANRADETSLSVSVWVARGDFPMTSGALLSSPALSYAEAAAGTSLVSNILGGPGIPASGASGPPAGAPTTMLGRTSSGIDITPKSPHEEDDNNAIIAAGQVWNNLLISLKSNGDGTTTILAYMNDTLLVNATGGALTASTAKAWPFQSQLGAAKDNGLSVWSLFGTKAANPIFDKVDVYSTITTPGVGGTPPTLANLIAALRGKTGLIPGLPDLFNYLINQRAQMTQPQMITGFRFTGNGGISNAPFDNAIGGVVGYVGNVGELWIKAGTFIDWTNATNRGYMHAINGVTGLFTPLSLGYNGAGTALGPPWIYLSGGPASWSLNRATGKRLTQLGPEFTASALSPPGSE